MDEKTVRNDAANSSAPTPFSHLLPTWLSGLVRRPRWQAEHGDNERWREENAALARVEQVELETSAS